MESEPQSTPSASRAKRVNRLAGTSRYSSRASFVQHLRHWWDRGQHPYRTQKEFATDLGISYGAHRSIINGRDFPSNPVCDRYYEKTGLDDFGPGRVQARAEHLRLKALRNARRKLSPGATKRALDRKRERYSENPAQAIAYEYKRRLAHRPRVADDELQSLRQNAAVQPEVCRECGKIFQTVNALSRHIGREHGPTADYQHRWGYTASWKVPAESKKKRLATFVERGLMGRARPHRRGLVAEKGKGLRKASAPPVRDWPIVELWLKGETMHKIAQATGLSLTAVFFRLWRTGSRFEADPGAGVGEQLERTLREVRQWLRSQDQPPTVEQIMEHVCGEARMEFALERAGKSSLRVFRILLSYGLPLAALLRAKSRSRRGHFEPNDVAAKLLEPRTQAQLIRRDLPEPKQLPGPAAPPISPATLLEQPAGADSGEPKPPARLRQEEGLEKLPPKRQDLSRYWESAGLTDRQRQCLSLRYEHELPYREIGRQLGLHHSTVYEEVQLGKLKLTRALANERRAKKRAVTDSDSVS